MTYFLCSHKAFRCSPLTLFSPLKLHSSVQSTTHKISSCMPCTKSQLLSSMGEKSREYLLPSWLAVAVGFDSASSSIDRASLLSLRFSAPPSSTCLPPAAALCSPSLSLSLSPISGERGAGSSPTECPLLFKTFSAHPDSTLFSNKTSPERDKLAGLWAGWKFVGRFYMEASEKCGVNKQVQKDFVFITSTTVSLKISFVSPSLSKTMPSTEK